MIWRRYLNYHRMVNPFIKGVKNDRYFYVDAILEEDLTFFGSGNFVKIKLSDGSIKKANKNALLYKDMSKGAKVSAMQGYIIEE